MNAKKDAPVGSFQPGKRVKNDVIFIVGLLVVALLAGLALLIFKAPGDTVVVIVDGEEWAEFALSENAEIEIPGVGGSNLLVIEDGMARVAQASCPDGICAAHRPIGRDGEIIICRPNKVVVEVHATEEDQPDIIT